MKFSIDTCFYCGKPIYWNFIDHKWRDEHNYHYCTINPYPDHLPGWQKEL